MTHAVIAVGMTALEAARRADLLALAAAADALARNTAPALAAPAAPAADTLARHAAPGPDAPAVDAAPAPAAPVSAAFLQIEDPPLTAELDRLADRGTREICLVGVALGGTGHSRSWLHRVAGHWLRTRGANPPTLLAAPDLLRTPDPAALADLARQGFRERRALAADQAPLENPSWQDVPHHRHQVFACRGPRCTAKGAQDVVRALNAALGEAGLGDDDVLLTITGCQFPCNHSPVVSVQPDDTWYGHMTPDAARALVAEHLSQAGPPGPDAAVSAHRLPRSPR